MASDAVICALVAIPTLFGLGLLWVGVTGPRE